MVYVDSGSTDDSVEQAELRGAEVVRLDMSSPFTAARARNAGVEHLLECYPQVEFVQFVDGDCQVEAGWMDAAQRELEMDPTLAVVCGRRREIDTANSVYNMLCDIEWDTPVGAADACGGDAMYRVNAFRAVGQFDEEFIAGEEPELCYRLRCAGWRIKRVNRDMTRHDANMHRFQQWWKRSQRSGYAYALGALEHGFGSGRYKTRHCLSVFFWGGALPLSLLFLAFFNGWMALLLTGLTYGYLGYRIYRHSRREHPDFEQRQTAIYSAFLVLQKFPELCGILQCGWQHMTGRGATIIEYK